MLKSSLPSDTTLTQFIVDIMSTPINFRVNINQYILYYLINRIDTFYSYITQEPSPVKHRLLGSISFYNYYNYYYHFLNYIFYPMSYHTSSTASFKTCNSDSELDLLDDNDVDGDDDDLELYHSSYPNSPTRKPLSVNSRHSFRRITPSSPSRIDQLLGNSTKRIRDNELSSSTSSNASEESFMTGSGDITNEEMTFTKTYDKTNDLYHHIQQLKIEINNINKKIEDGQGGIYYYYIII